MTTPVRDRSANLRPVGSCPDCGAETPLAKGRIGAHRQAIIRGGALAVGDWCHGEGDPPDVDVAGLDPVVVDLVGRRRAKGWTRQEFAARMSRSRDTVTRMEQGVSVPSLALLRDAATALGCELALVGAR